MKINVCSAYLMTANEVTHLYLDHAAVFAFNTHRIYVVIQLNRHVHPTHSLALSLALSLVCVSMSADSTLEVNRCHTLCAYGTVDVDRQSIENGLTPFA